MSQKIEFKYFLNGVETQKELIDWERSNSISCKNENEIHVTPMSYLLDTDKPKTVCGMSLRYKACNSDYSTAIENKTDSNLIGKKFITNEGYPIEIISKDGKDRFSIRFENGCILKNRHITSIRKGAVSNPYHKSVYGVGYLGVGKYEASDKNGHLKVYKLWHGILQRCYSDNFIIKNPSYIGCTVDEKWHNFQVFAEWFYKKYDSTYMKGWQLDKDIKVKGNKVYSPETCCFVPQEINKLVSNCTISRGKYPIGVSKHRNKFRATLTVDGSKVVVGNYYSKEEASEAYKFAKNIEIKRKADKWKNLLDVECYEALYKY